jgi:hypothetical protein
MVATLTEIHPGRMNMNIKSSHSKSLALPVTVAILAAAAGATPSVAQSVICEGCAGNTL